MVAKWLLYLQVSCQQAWVLRRDKECTDSLCLPFTGQNYVKGAFIVVEEGRQETGSKVNE